MNDVRQQPYPFTRTLRTRSVSSILWTIEAEAEGNSARAWFTRLSDRFERLGHHEGGAVNARRTIVEGSTDSVGPVGKREGICNGDSFIESSFFAFPQRGVRQSS